MNDKPKVISYGNYLAMKKEKEKLEAENAELKAKLEEAQKDLVVLTQVSSENEKAIGKEALKSISHYEKEARKRVVDEVMRESFNDAYKAGYKYGKEDLTLAIEELKARWERFLFEVETGFEDGEWLRQKFEKIMYDLESGGSKKEAKG